MLPAILRYDDPFQHAFQRSTEIFFETDMKGHWKQLWILGTSLQIKGVQSMIQDALHRNPDLQIFYINRDPPPAKMETVIDIFLQGDCDTWSNMVHEAVYGSGVPLVPDLDDDAHPNPPEAAQDPQFPDFEAVATQMAQGNDPDPDILRRLGLHKDHFQATDLEVVWGVAHGLHLHYPWMHAVLSIRTLFNKIITDSRLP